jgi:hypothetical protein
MPVLSYFVIVGLALIGLLFVADAVLPHDTRLQVRSNFEGIPPAPPRQYTRSALVAPAPVSHISSPEAGLAVEPSATELPELRAPEPEMSATSVPAAAPPQVGDFRYVELRNIGAPQVPMPAQEVAVAAYADETHVDNHRKTHVAEPSLLQAAEPEVATASVSQAEKPRRKVKSASLRLAKRQPPYKSRKYAARKREEREDGFVHANTGISDWSWHEKERHLATERRWHAGGSRSRAWRDPYWRSESPSNHSNWSSPSWR